MEGKKAKYYYFLLTTYHVQGLAPYFHLANLHHSAINFLALKEFNFRAQGKLSQINLNPFWKNSTSDVFHGDHVVPLRKVN